MHSRWIDRLRAWGREKKCESKQESTMDSAIERGSERRTSIEDMQKQGERTNEWEERDDERGRGMASGWMDTEVRM